MSEELVSIIVGGLITLITTLVGYNFISSIRAITKRLEDHEEKHKDHYKKDHEQDLELQRNNIEIMTLKRTQPFDSEKFADAIVSKIRAITPKDNGQ